MPEAPDWLPNAHAIREWKRLAPICMRIGTLTDGTLMMFAHLCSIHGKLVQLTAAGSLPSASLVSQLRALAADFGLSSRVISAPKIPSETPKQPTNRFERFRAD